MTVDIREAPDLVQRLRETCHDMRQPVASVFALAAAALAEPGLPAAARKRVKQIVGQAEWLADMLTDFMHDVQPEDADGAAGTDLGQADGPSGHPDVVLVVNEVIAVGCLTWRCDVAVDSPAAPVQCTLHPTLLRRTVSNVLDNAARAAGPCGIVKVRIGRRSKGLVLFSVEDSGPGFGNIPSGASLGLSAVARTIVRAGGRMECGRGAGGGARVSLWLP